MPSVAHQKRDSDSHLLGIAYQTSYKANLTTLNWISNKWCEPIQKKNKVNIVRDFFSTTSISKKIFH